jgi:hypothetical protein
MSLIKISAVQVARQKKNSLKKLDVFRPGEELIEKKKSYQSYP